MKSRPAAGTTVGVQGGYFATHHPITSATPSHSHSAAPLARPISVQAMNEPIRNDESHGLRPIEPPR